MCMYKSTFSSSWQAYDSSFSNDSALDYGITQLQPHIHPSQGILIELLLSILLVMVFVHTTMERSEFRSVAPVVIGLALTAAIVSRYVCVQYTHVVHKIMVLYCPTLHSFSLMFCNEIH